ncbi:hypothetical protein ACSQ67_020667 [Phaseolus vulgaris]
MVLQASRSSDSSEVSLPGDNDPYWLSHKDFFRRGASNLSPMTHEVVSPISNSVMGNDPATLVDRSNLAEESSRRVGFD